MKQKSENQKAFPRFLGILVVASLIGGVLGGLSGVPSYHYLSWHAVHVCYTTECIYQ